MSLTLVDNPGGGDCGAYAFVLGVLDLAHRHGRRDLLDTWKTLDPSISSLLDNSSAHPSNLKPFMESIRRILFNDFLSTQPRPNRRLPVSFYNRAEFKSLIFDELLLLCTWYYFKHVAKMDKFEQALFSVNEQSMNAIYLYYYGFQRGHQKLRMLVDQIVQLAIREQIIPLGLTPKETIVNINGDRFNRLIYAALIKHHDLFTEFYRNIYTRNGTWLIEASLCPLAELFKVHICMENEIQDLGTKNTRSFTQNFPSGPFIYLKNCRNGHWKTYLYNPAFTYPQSQVDELILFREAVQFYFKDEHRESFLDHQQLLLEKFSDQRVDLTPWLELYSSLLQTIKPLIDAQILNIQDQKQFIEAMQDYRHLAQRFLDQIHAFDADLNLFRFFQQYYEETINRHKLLEALNKFDKQIAEFRVKICLNPARALEYQGLMQEVTERKLSYLAQLEQPEVDSYIQEFDQPISKPTQASNPIYFFKNVTPEKMVSAPPTQCRFLGGILGLLLGGVVSLAFPSLIASMATALMITNLPVIFGLMFALAVVGFAIGYFCVDQKPSVGPK